MTTLTPDYLHLFTVLGLKAICTSNRDSFNLLNRQQIIQLLITKLNEGSKIVIPPFILTNKIYFKLKKSYIKILLNI